MRYHCPYCNVPIDPDDVDVNSGEPDGFGELYVEHRCPACGENFYAVFEDGGNNDFKRTEEA